MKEKVPHLLLPQNGFERLPKLWQDDEAICNSFHANGANQQFSFQPSGAIQSGVFLFRWLLIPMTRAKQIRTLIQYDYFPNIKWKLWFAHILFL